MATDWLIDGWLIDELKATKEIWGNAVSLLSELLIPRYNIHKQMVQYKKMAESRPKDALVNIVETAETVETVYRHCADCGDSRDSRV